MTKEQYLEQIETLNILTSFYDEGRPLVSDKKWDELYFQVEEYEKETGYVSEKSPTQSIQYTIVNKLQKVKHNHLMLSLNKTKDINDIISWAGSKEIIAMCKMDGLTCSLLYKDGKLLRAETRGNGIIGEDVTHNAKKICNIPKYLDEKLIYNVPTYINIKDEVTIDGEVICKYKDFESFKNDYKNPRNFASGSIRLLDSKECSKRKLSFVAWDGIKGFNNVDNLFYRLQELYDLGFETVPRVLIGEKYSYNEGIEFLRRQAEKLSYPIDGIVFKYNIDKDYNEAGQTDHHFKGGLAYKFYDESYESSLQSIDWSMGRRGTLTPVAEFTPIEIEGTTVSRASLHNIDIMRQTLHGNGFLNQTVKVSKMNMIIPQIISAETPDSSIKEFEIPSVCPICGGPLKIKDDNGTKELYCINPDCSGKILNKIEHFAGKKALDIKGISKATLDKLINDWEWVSSPKDLFTLNKYKKEWSLKAGFGEKSVNNMLDSIEQSKNTELWRIISAADIPNIGITASKDLANYFKTWDKFRYAIDTNFDFTVLPNFGETADYDIKHHDYTEIDFIVKNYLIYNEVKEAAASAILQSKVFVITGKLKHFKNRAELKDKIEANGGKVTNSVTKNTNYLINNDITSTSSKNVTAKKLNIPIITEDEMIQIFKQVEN